MRIIVVATALLLAAPSAHAATVARASSGAVEVLAAAGEANRLSVSVEAAALVLRDAAVPLEAGRDCATEAGAVRCPLAPLVVTLGDGDDAFEVHGVPPALEVNGGTGDDVLAGAAGADRLLGAEGDDVLRGGDGEDLLGAGDGRDVLDGGTDTDRLAMNRDGAIDRVACGNARDVVTFTEFADRIGPDCELLGDLDGENRISARPRTLSRGGVVGWRSLCVCTGRLEVRTERGTLLGRSTVRDLRGAGRVLAVRLRRAQAARLRGRTVRIRVTIVNARRPIRFPQRIRF